MRETNSYSEPVSLPLSRSSSLPETVKRAATPSQRDDDDLSRTPRKRSSAYVSSPVIPTAKQAAVRSNLLDAYGVPVAESNNANRTSAASRRANGFSDRIRVCVRKRPLNKKELKRNEIDIADVYGKRSIVINEPKYVLTFFICGFCFV